MTKRAKGFLITAFVLYVFGNQTQTGWLYVMSALIAALVVVGWLLNRGSLRGIAAERGLSAEALYEADQIMIDLRLKRNRGLHTYQVQLTEVCPLSSPDQREKRLYAPVIPTHQPLTYRYPVTLDRRGVYDFPPIQLRSGFPFGFFRRSSLLNIATSVLVYPEVQPLTHFPLLEKQLAAQLATQRIGRGSEVLGVRPFRSGDSPRHIHWRSTARTGQLMSKEFADEAQPNLTLVFDTAYTGEMSEKHSPFEWAVKATVSIADYAKRRAYPLKLAHGDSRIPLISSVLDWDALLNIMARLQPDATLFDHVCAQAGDSSMVAAVIPMPSAHHVPPLATLKARGVSVLAVLIDSRSFHDELPSADSAFTALLAAGIDSVIVRSSHIPADQLASALTPQGLSRESVAQNR